MSAAIALRQRPLPRQGPRRSAIRQPANADAAPLPARVAQGPARAKPGAREERLSAATESTPTIPTGECLPRHAARRAAARRRGQETRAPARPPTSTPPPRRLDADQVGAVLRASRAGRGWASADSPSPSLRHAVKFFASASSSGLQRNTADAAPVTATRTPPSARRTRRPARRRQLRELGVRPSSAPGSADRGDDLAVSGGLVCPWKVVGGDLALVGVRARPSRAPPPGNRPQGRCWRRAADRTSAADLAVADALGGVAHGAG